MSLIDTKVEELTAVVNTYQALGGGTMWSVPNQGGVLGPVPDTHTVRSGENFWTISRRYYRLAAHTPELPGLVQYPGDPSIFLAAAPGIRRSITSGDTEPAVLLVLSIEPQAIWSATLAP